MKHTKCLGISNTVIVFSYPIILEKTMAVETAVIEPKRSFSDKMLDGIERVGNKVPHPVLMFAYLIVIVIVLSHILYLMGVSVTESIAVPVATVQEVDQYGDTTADIYGTPEDSYDQVDYEIREQTIAIQSLLTVEGIRFLFSSFVTNFQNFGVVAVTFIAMMGAGVADVSGMMGALIRQLVKKSPRRLITFLIVLVGAISSVASDAGYLILIPLGAAAFLALGRHPIAGLAAAFGGVAATFAVNFIITPTDAMLTEVTNEAILLAGGTPISITANYFFMVASTLILSIAITIVTERMVEPRLGKYLGVADEPVAAVEIDDKAEARGLRGATIGALAVLVIVFLASAFPGAPLRHPETGALIGTTPFMDSLLFIIMLFFLVSGIGFGFGAGTFKHANDVIAAVTKTFASLGGLIFMLLMISQFIAYFNFTNMPQVLAVNLADFLEQAGIPALPLLVGMVLVIVLLDFIIPGALPKWAIFAPIFIPLFIRLGTSPQTVLAAYRIGDSPVNTLTPLMVYLPFIVTIAQRYQKDAGIGTIVALMIPYALVVLVVWIILFVLWFVLGIPLGPGYPVAM
jgi:aminobenzoyl-glutamate transport protein